jgi:hypothetical protein
VVETTFRGVRDTGSYPTVAAWTVPAAGVQMAVGGVSSAPNNHFTAGPHSRLVLSAIGGVGGAGGCPRVRAEIISPAGSYKGAAVESPHTIISLPVHTAV